jgi:hypothetical protein
MDLAAVLVMLVIVVVVEVLVLVRVLRAVEMLVNVQVGRVRVQFLFDAHDAPFFAWESGQYIAMIDSCPGR